MRIGDEIPHLLIVDDDVDFIRLLARTLSNGGYQVSCAESGEQALELLQRERVELVLLDIRMPRMDGFATCRRIKSIPEVADTPVLFMTAENRSNEILGQALAAGACDYLTKPLSRADVLTRVRYTVQQRMESRWIRQWDVDDQLTGLPSRNYFKQRLAEELSEYERLETPVSVVLLELDGLDESDASNGEAATDACVARFSRLLRAESRHHDVTARLGRGRFAVMLPRVTLAGAKLAAQRMLDIWKLTDAWVADDELTMSARCAVEAYPETVPVPDAGDLLKVATDSLAQAIEAESAGAPA